MKAAAVWIENNNRNPGPNLLTPGTMPGCRVSNSGREQTLLLPLQEGCVADAIGPHSVISQKKARATWVEGHWLQGWTPMLQTGKKSHNKPCHQLSTKLSKPGLKERGGPCLMLKCTGKHVWGGYRAWRSELWLHRAVSILASLISSCVILLIYPLGSKLSNDFPLYL